MCRASGAKRLRQDDDHGNAARAGEADSGQLQPVRCSIPHQDALHRVGAIVETPSFYPYLSGRDNLAYFQGICGRGDRKELDNLLDKVGLADRAKSRFRTYSLGVKQRLGLAYALLGYPDLLFLDEPTNGMDPAGMAEVRDMIRGLGTGERTVLLSSHLLHEVEQVCDSVAILSKGKLIAQGKVAYLVHSRAGERVRLRTTDNAKAVEVLSVLEWVGEVKIEGESVIVEAPGERSSELSTALETRTEPPILPKPSFS